ncbi:DUF2249 domain-containing protein [Actinoplanes awajinensis]|uniref:DUF2249 domain-containing protein n=1 Tax=Actinoplanes awajinensis TaxID=135946 RepID=UPI000A91F773|nr:DUF2249 domain-containing protein [Actinoplanes awajinensis]
MREVEHDQRHGLVRSTVAALFILVASHALRLVLAEIGDRFGAQIDAPWLQSGPDMWQIRLEQVAEPA